MAKVKPTCSVEDCNRTTVARGWCDKHYRRWKAHGDPLKRVLIHTHKRGVPCLVDDCNGLSLSRGLCSVHYHRMYQYGSLETTRVPSKVQEDWIDRHIAHSGDDCLIWPYAKTRHGYATVCYGGEFTTASRIMCRLAHGEPADKAMEAAHICGKGHEGCVHPKHLCWKTHIENEADKLVHGTSLRGEKAINAKLKEGDVRQIRVMGKSMPHQDVADMFGVSKSLVSQIVRRKTWAWLEG